MSDKETTVETCYGCGNPPLCAIRRSCHRLACGRQIIFPSERPTPISRDDESQPTDFYPCPEGRERCAVDGVECECERREEEKIRSETTLKPYLLTAYDAEGQLDAAEFVKGLPISVLDAAERWTEQCGEFRIKRAGDPNVGVVQRKTTLEKALALLKRVEDALYDQVTEPCCGWGPLYQEIADFLDSAQSERSLTS